MFISALFRLKKGINETTRNVQIWIITRINCRVAGRLDVEDFSSRISRRSGRLNWCKKIKSYVHWEFRIRTSQKLIIYLAKAARLLKFNQNKRASNLIKACCGVIFLGSEGRPNVSSRKKCYFTAYTQYLQNLCHKVENLS